MRLPEVLCYPSPGPGCAKERMKELVNCGVEEILNEGKLLLRNWRVFGKGHSAVILKARLKSKKVVAVKVLRSDSKRDDLSLECSFLARGYPVTPEVYCCSKGLIVMELIDGFSLEEVFRHELMCRKALPTVLKVFEAVNWLDRVGIDHKELSRPAKHVYITREGKVKIIDFETASGGPAKNLLRVFSWFIIRSWFGSRCCNNTNELIDEAIPLLRLYIEEPRKAFREVVKLVVRECSSPKDIYS